MSGKLDQSLDEILSTRRTTSRRGRGGRRAPNPAKPAAPVGGVKKTTKSVVKTGTRGTAPSGPAATGESKIVVSNLPPDVNESQIKEYFQKSVGSVKRVMITYGPNGTSRGIATIIFAKPNSASDAAVKLNGLLVDKRPMKIEVIVDASRAPAPEPVRGMGERITKPKVQPKQATAAKVTAGTARGGRGGRAGRGGRGGRVGRGKPKTAEDLDAEMADYFVGGNGTAGAEGAATEGVAPAASGEDQGMDEVS